jgi:hypothetical protein
VPRRGLESEHKPLILNVISMARSGLPTKNPTTEATLARVLPITPQWSKFRLHPQAETCSSTRQNGGSGTTRTTVLHDRLHAHGSTKEGRGRCVGRSDNPPAKEPLELRSVCSLKSRSIKDEFGSATTLGKRLAVSQVYESRRGEMGTRASQPGVGLSHAGARRTDLVSKSGALDS